MICRSAAWKPVSLTCWINKNLFNSNKIWWGDNFASMRHKGLSHVQGCCTPRANQLKAWSGSSAHDGQDDKGRYDWSGPPLGTGLHVPTKQSKVILVASIIIQTHNTPHEYIIRSSESDWYTWRNQFYGWFDEYPALFFNQISPLSYVK